MRKLKAFEWNSRGVSPVVLSLGTGGVLAVCLLAVWPAWGFTRSQTCVTEFRGNVRLCDPGETPLPLRWTDACVSYHLNERGYLGGYNERQLSSIQGSFESWMEPSCSFLHFVYAGMTDVDDVGYDRNKSLDDNQNIIMFREDAWNHDPDVLALTTVSYNPKTGDILDADIEFNGVSHVFSLNPSAQKHDMINTVTHEVGHLLGLDHSPINDATMYEDAPPGEFRKRTLEQDDIDGLCTIYPQEEICERTNSLQGRCPAGSFIPPKDCPEDPNTGGANGATSSGCCSTVPTRNYGNFGWLVLGVVALWGVRRRKRRTRRVRTSL